MKFNDKLFMNDRLFTIEEVSNIVEVKKHTIRYWEKEFNSFLNWKRTKGNHRRFTQEDIEKIKIIKFLLKEEGYSIRGAKKFLQKMESTTSFIKRQFL